MKKKKVNAYFAIFVFETRRCNTLPKLLVFLVLLALSLYMTQNGVSKFKRVNEKKETFKQLENEKVKQYFNYRVYGLYGYRQLLVPHPEWIFFSNSTPVSDITAYVDAGERLRIYKPMQGSDVFEVNKNWITDYSGIVLFFAGLSVLLFGFDGVSNKEYLKFLSSLCGKKRAFFYTLAARAMLVTLLLAFITSCAVLLVFANGLILTENTVMLGFLLLVFLAMIFFLVLGSVFAHMKKKGWGMFWALTSWLVSVFVIPTILGTITESRAKEIKSIYTLELKKMKIVMNFEKKALAELGQHKFGDSVSKKRKEFASSYMKNEVETIHSLESAMIAEMERNAGVHQLLASLFPTTFYIYNGNELSGMGYNSLVRFYEIVRDAKAGFSRYIMDKVYFSNYKKVEAYRNANENVRQGIPVFTDYFKWGVFCSVLWIAAFLVISYTLHKKSLLHIPKNETAAATPFHRDMDSGDFHEWSVDTNFLNTLLFNTLANPAKILRKKGLDVTLVLDENNIENHADFLYLCRAKHLPCDIRARYLLDFVMTLMSTPREKKKEILHTYDTAAFGGKTTDRLNIDEMGRLYLAMVSARQYKIYLADDITGHMYSDFAVALKHLFDNYCRNGSVVMYLNAFGPLKRKGKKGYRYFKRSRRWQTMVNDYKSEDADKTPDEGGKE